MSQACAESFATLTTYSIAVPQNSIDQLLIRHNQKGTVRLLRSNASDSMLRLDVAWNTRSQAEFDRHYMVFGKLGDEPDSYLLQVGLSAESDSVLLQWSLLGVLALVAIVIISILIFWYMRRKRWKKMESSRNQQDGAIELTATNPRETVIQANSTMASDADRLVQLSGAFLQQSDSKSTNITELVGSPLKPRQPPVPVFSTSLSAQSICNDRQSAASIQTRESGSLRSSSSGGRFVLISAIIFAVLTVAHSAELLPFLSCSDMPFIHVSIIVPKNVEIETVQAFFQQDFTRQTRLLAFGFDDYTKLPDLATYDVRSAGRVGDARCDPQAYCPLAAHQGLVGCDTAEKCVCRRGFEMVDGVCVDVNECLQRPRPCSINAACDNTIGSFTCTCDEGFYGDGRNCTEIELHSLKQPCNACGENAYDVRGCLQPNRTYCIPIEYASPVDHTGAQVAKNSLQVRSLVVRTSDNAFVENLMEAGEISQKVYVTDNRNSQEFSMTRPSNLTVSVKVYDMQLVPEISDQQFESDNSFMLGRKGSPTPEQMVFERIVKTHCRNPMPDYYSLSLDIYRDRTTLMLEELCDSANPARKVCPEPLLDGVDTIRYRSLNDPCPSYVLNASSKVTKPPKKSRLVPMRLFEESNSILCMDNVPLLTRLFNQSLSSEKFELPPNRSEECKTAERSCEQCELDNALKDACPAASSGQNATTATVASKICTYCSRKQCYAHPDCRRSMQPPCAEVLPVCARGDVARFTLQPVFANIRSEFRCPVQFVRQKRLNDSNLVPLFRIEYSLSVPGLPFRTIKLHETVTSRLAKSDLLVDSGSASAGVFDIDYKVNLLALSRLNDKVDFVLVGKLQNDSRYHLQLERIKSAPKWNKQYMLMRENRMVVAVVQPRRPFRISTSTWMKNYQNCHQSSDEFYAHQEMFDAEESNEMNANDIKVEQIRKPASDYDSYAESEETPGQYSYLLTSKTTLPSITFRLPAKRSALAQYFANQDNILQTDERNLRTSLQFDAHSSLFNLTVQGRVRRCGLLQLTLSEFYSRTTVLHCDVLVQCPSSAPQSPQPFSLTSAFQLHYTSAKRSGLKAHQSDAQAAGSKYVFELKITDLTITHVVKMVYDEPVQALLSEANLNAHNWTKPANTDRPISSQVEQNEQVSTTVQDTLQQWTLSVNLMALAIAVVAAYLLLITVHCALRTYMHLNYYCTLTYPTIVRPVTFPITTRSVLLDAPANSLTVLASARKHEPKSAEEVKLTASSSRHGAKSNRRTNVRSRRGTSVCVLSLVVFARVVHHAVFNVSLFFALVLFINQTHLKNVESLLFNASQSQATSTSHDLKARRLGDMESEFSNLAQVTAMCNSRLNRLAEDLRFQAENVADYHLSQLFKVDYNANARLSVLNVLETRFMRMLSGYRAQLDTYFAHYRNKVLPAQLGKQYAVLNKLLFKVYDSTWLQFARNIFNETAPSRKWSNAHSVLAALYEANDTVQLKSLLFKREHIEFTNFLNVPEMEQLAFVPLQLVSTFESKRPRYAQAGFVRVEQVNEIVNTVILAEDASRKQTSALPFCVKLPAGATFASGVVSNSQHAASSDSLNSNSIKDSFTLVRVLLLAFDLLLFASRLLFTFNFARALWAGLPVVHYFRTNNAGEQGNDFDLYAYLKNKPSQTQTQTQSQCLASAKKVTNASRPQAATSASSFSGIFEVFTTVWSAHLSVKRAMIIGIVLSAAFAFETVASAQTRGQYDQSNAAFSTMADQTLASNVRRQMGNLDTAIDNILMRREQDKVRRKVERMKQFTNQFNYDQWKTLHTHQLVGCALTQPNASTIDTNCLQTVTQKQQLLSTDYLGGCNFLPNRPSLTRSFLDSSLKSRSVAANRELATSSIHKIIRSIVFLFIIGVSVSELLSNFIYQVFLDFVVLKMAAEGTFNEIRCSPSPPCDRVIQDHVTRVEATAREQCVVHQPNHSLQHQFSSPDTQIWDSENPLAPSRHESRV